MKDIRIVEEKDYIKNVKPNGYRSYHVIIEITQPYEDVTGQNPGRFCGTADKDNRNGYVGEFGASDEIQA